jgi:hypothetical protein
MGFLWFLVVLGILVVGVVVGAVVFYAVALARRSKAQLAAGVESVPGMPTGAPAEWAGSHSPEAKMHRRLTGLARTLAALPLGDAASIERRTATEQRIQSLDRRLIALAGAPDATRRDAVSALSAEVDAAETEVGALAVDPGLG